MARFGGPSSYSSGLILLRPLKGKAGGPLVIGLGSRRAFIKRLSVEMILLHPFPMGGNALESSCRVGFVQKIIEGLLDEGKAERITKRQQFFRQDLLAFQEHIAEFTHDRLEYETGNGREKGRST